MTTGCRARPLICALTVLGLAGGGIAVSAGSAHAATSVVTPTALTATAGSTGGQPVSALAVQDQSGTTDTWAKYVEFRGLYAGYTSYTLPSAVSATAITALQVKANYRGPAIATQTWTWSLYNWSTGSWVAMGTNASAPDWGAWKLLTFGAGGTLANYVSTSKNLRVQIKSNNSADSADVDYLGLVVTSADGTDTTPPSVPAGVTVTAVTASSVSLSWTASTDNIAVTGYEVFVGAAASPAVVTSATTGTVTGLAASTAYGFSVKAKDGAGNRSAASASVSATTAGPATVAMPPVNGQFDYQIGGAYAPSASVAIVDRDRTAPAVAGKYNICYVNGFQTQPGEAGLWPSSVILKDSSGNPIVDPGWPGEYILDTRTAANRTAIMNVLRPWFQGCKNAGYQAIEPDNLDSYTRSQNLMDKSPNMTMATLMAGEAHAIGIAIAQKNDTTIAPVGKDQIGFDFAIVEECQPYNECGAFITEYGDRVYEIEYTDNGGLTNFNAACAARGSSLSIIYRDRNVVPAGSAGYTYRAC